jgi:plastocyanin
VLERSLLTAFVATAAIGLAACGNDNKDNASSTPAPATTPAPAGTTADGGAAAGALAIAADPSGQLAFDKKSLSAKAGDVTVDFTNDSQVPHNVTIEQGQKELGATDTIQGSKTSKSFTLKKGTYSFYCSVGNHKAAGMQGTLTVQ